MANTTLSILEIAELCDKDGLVLESRFMKEQKKDQKETLVQRWFLNRVGVRGTLTITSGDIVKSSEDSSYQRPFLGKKPERHPDSPVDATSRGALTIIPDPAEQEAWIKFNRWIKKEILRTGAVRDKKNQVVTTMEKLESEFKDIIVEPEAGNDLRKNVCLWQKFQVGGKIPELDTKFYYVSCETSPKGEKYIKRGAEFGEDVWKAGSGVYSVIQVGELKKAPTGWGIPLYTRQAFTDAPTDDGAREPVVVFGGIRMKTAEEAEQEENELMKEITEKVEKDKAEATSPAKVKAIKIDRAAFDAEGVSSDVTNLALNFAKFSDSERTDTKRARTDI